MVAAGIVSARRNAREAGASELLRSLAVSPFGGLGAVELAQTLSDVRRAEKYSSHFERFVRDRLDKPGAIKAIDSRLVTIGVTENAAAYNEHRHKTAADISARYRVKLIEIWDSMLDKRVCEHCLALDGSESINGAGFPDGQRPGLVHPRCRCTSHFMVMR